MTPNELKRKGIDALVNALGPTGMARFLQQFEPGSGDYTKEREKWLDDKNIDEISDEIIKQRKKST